MWCSKLKFATLGDRQKSSGFGFGARSLLTDFAAKIALTITFAFGSAAALAQTATPPGTPKLGTEGVSCVISAANRNSVVFVDGGYAISGIPATFGPVRGRATCSDGSVGQTPVVFTIRQNFDPNFVGEVCVLAPMLHRRLLMAV